MSDIIGILFNLELVVCPTYYQMFDYTVSLAVLYDELLPHRMSAKVFFSIMKYNNPRVNNYKSN